MHFSATRPVQLPNWISIFGGIHEIRGQCGHDMLKGPCLRLFCHVGSLEELGGRTVHAKGVEHLRDFSLLLTSCSSPPGFY